MLKLKLKTPRDLGPRLRDLAREATKAGLKTVFKIDGVLPERGKEYGPTRPNFALAAHFIQEYVRARGGRLGPEDYAAILVLVKVARLATGNNKHTDTWLDIEGYAKLAQKLGSDTSMFEEAITNLWNNHRVTPTLVMRRTDAETPAGNESRMGDAGAGKRAGGRAVRIRRKRARRRVSS